MSRMTLLAAACALSFSAGADSAGNQAKAAQVAPSIGNLGDVTIKAWNSPTSLIDADATVVDPDSANFAAGILTVKLVATGSSTVTANDLMTILSAGTGAGQINVSGTDLRWGATSIGTWNGATVSGATVLKVTFKSTATPAAVQALLRRIAYRNSSTTPILKDKTVRFQVSDGDGGTSAAVNKIIRLVQAPPTLGNLADVMVKAWNSPFSPIDPDATVADPDSANFNTGILSAKLVATATSTVTANDHLTILSAGTGAGQINISGADVRWGSTSIGTWNGMAVSGATVLKVTLKSTATPSAVQALLRRIAYRNAAATKVLGDKTVQFQVSDGDGGTSLAVNKIVRLESYDGNYTGTLVGSYTAFGEKDTIPGNAIPPGKNNFQMVISNGTATITVPGVDGSATGTVSTTGSFSAVIAGNVSGVNVTINFAGTITLNPDHTATGSGTWTVVNTPGVTGSGTWTTKRP